jgi:F0F1-type ATP synthase assembly protein I
MEPPAPRSFPPVEAGALLAAVTLLAIGLGALLGWLAGSTKIGLIVGAVVGLPAGVSSVYLRYHEYFA